MEGVLKLDGRTASSGSPLVMHNERLADPLDDFSQAISGISGKRKKTIPDHEDMAELEFYGGLYTEPALTCPVNGVKAEIGVPAWNILRCLQDGGKRHKRGLDVPRGIYPLREFATLKFDGPKDPQKLWQGGGFSLRKSVGVQRSRTMRTRPFFADWQTELPIEVDSTVFDRHTLETIWREAGIYAGLGDMRPIYGRFTATIVWREKA